jgi:hypothetical protein
VSKDIGLISTVWAGKPSFCDYVNGVGQQARFNGTSGICAAPNSGMYVADTNNHVIRKIDSAQNVTTTVGTPGSQGTMMNDINILALARFKFPQGVAGTGTKNFFIADTGNHCIWYVNRDNGNVYLVAGEPGVPGDAPGVGRAARFSSPRLFTNMSPDGTTLVVEDYGNGGSRTIAVTPSGNGGMIGSVN